MQVKCSCPDCCNQESTIQKQTNEQCVQNETAGVIRKDLVKLLQQYFTEQNLLPTKSKSSVNTQTDGSSYFGFAAVESQTCNKIPIDADTSSTNDTNLLNLRMIFDFTNELRNTRNVLVNLKKENNIDPDKLRLVESLHSTLETNIRQMTTCIKNIESIPSRCDMLKNKLKLSKKYIMEKENEILVIKNENKILTDKVADITRKFEESNRLILESDRVCCDLQETISRLKVEVIKLKEASRNITDKKINSSDTDNEIMNLKLRINNLYAALKKKNVALNEQSMNLNQMLALNKELQQKLFRAETLNLNKTSILSTYKERANSSQRELSEVKDTLKNVKDSKSSLQSRLSKLEVTMRRSQGRLKRFDVATQCDRIGLTNDKSITCLELKESSSQTEQLGDYFDEQIKDYHAKYNEIQAWLVKSESKAYQYEVTIQQFLTKVVSRKEEALQHNSKSKLNGKNETAFEACDLLELTPAEIAQLYDTNKHSDSGDYKNSSVYVNEWMVTIRNITQCPIFSEALSCYLYKIVLQFISA